MQNALELLAKQVRFSPDSAALISDHGSVSYRDLHQQSELLAKHLRLLGIGRQMFVGVYIERSPDAVIAIFGILKAGAAYVSLQVKEPWARLRVIVEDARISLIITNRKTVSQVLDRIPVESVCLDDVAKESSIESASPISVGIDEVACVTYTSGSTGTPKGAVYSHRHLVHRIPSVPSKGVWCLNSPLNFGFSLSSLFPPLLQGAQLVIPNEAATDNVAVFAQMLDRYHVTRLALVPTALRQLIECARTSGVGLKSVRDVTVAGAPITPALAKSFSAFLPSAKLHYGYGATETGPVTLREITNGDCGDPRSIGHPQPSTQLLILDDSMRRVPQGQVGELFVSSPHLAKGYLNDPELTARLFLRNPFSTDESTAIMFRTGDFAAFLPDGQIRLLGRVDNQIKIRGFRIQLEEIESVLVSDPRIREAAVTARGLRDSENQLVAYIVPERECTLTVEELRQRAAHYLPEYMMPGLFFVLEQLPRTNTGKLDRKALPQLDQRPDLATPYRGPRSAVEIDVAQVWTEFLRLDRVGIDDHFVELGGDSLTAVQIETRLAVQFDLKGHFVSVWEHPTIASLAEKIEGGFAQA